MKPALRIAALLLVAALTGCATSQASQADQHQAHHPDAATASTPEKSGDRTAK